VFLWLLEFFLFVISFWLLLTMFSDLLRDHETSGGRKAVWIIVLVVLPYLGILIYLIAHAKTLLDSGAIDQAEFDRLMAVALAPELIQRTFPEEDRHGSQTAQQNVVCRRYCRHYLKTVRRLGVEQGRAFADGLADRLLRSPATAA